MSPSSSIALAPPNAGPIAYEQLRSRQLDSFNSQFPAFLDAVMWPPAQLRAARQKRLRDIVAYAKAKSPWHARRLSLVDPAQLTEESLSDIPPMSKLDLMEHFDEIVTDPRIRRVDVETHLATLTSDRYFHETSHAVASGGSSGRRGLFVYDWDSWVTFGLSSARPIALALQASALNVRDRAVAFVGGHASHSSAAFTQSFAPWLLAQFGNFAALPMSLPLAAIIERLNALQPTCLSAYPSFLIQLCFAARTGALAIRPTAILVGGETLFPEHQRLIEETFGAHVFNFYGCSEASCLGFSCPCGDGLHLSEDTIICEPIDRTGQPSPIGKVSDKILLTNLFNWTLPLIRYEIDDQVLAVDQSFPCKCGSSFRKLQAITGRFDETFVYECGVAIHPIIFRSALGIPSVVEYQVQQTREGIAVTLSATDHVDRAKLIAQLRQELAQHGLPQPNVSITIADRIDRTDAGKLRRFIPLRETSLPC